MRLNVNGYSQAPLRKEVEKHSIRSGTGKLGVRYYYYRCKNRDCHFKVPASEIESLILGRIKKISKKKEIIDAIVKQTNLNLQKELPVIKEQRTVLMSELEKTKEFAEGIINKWESLGDDESSIFIKEKLEKLGKRRKDIESGIQSLNEMIEEIERETISQEMVELALGKFNDVFQHIKPYQQKELVGMVVHKAIVGPEKLKIALYGRLPDIDAVTNASVHARSMTPVWRPQVDAFRNWLITSPEVPLLVKAIESIPRIA